MTEFEIFVGEGDNGKDCVAILLRGASIVEDTSTGELTPLLGLTPDMACMMAGALIACAEQIKANE
jgi:hypothetical protein